MRLMIVTLGLLAMPALAWADDRAAIAKAIPLLEKGMRGHREARECFACHNQGAPMMALTLAEKRGFTIDAEEKQKQIEHIRAFLGSNLEGYKKGQGQGGQASTAAQSLWALELAGGTSDELSTAMTHYLVERDRGFGPWKLTSSRPPTGASLYTTAYYGVRALSYYRGDDERIDKRLEAVRGWALKTPAKDTEDRVFRLLTLAHTKAGETPVKEAAEVLREAQHKDGGWAQLDSMEPDAYATATVLVALHESAHLKSSDEAYQRGLAFLRKTQEPDGSWHVKTRAKGFQKYYESGFPHGKDQFLSMSATSFAVTAMVYALPE